MSWEIIAALIVIVGCLISLGTVLAKLVATLTRLDITLKDVQRMVDEHEVSNTKSHERIFGQLDNHEERITHLEHKE